MGFSPGYRLALVVGPLWLGGLYLAYRVQLARAGASREATTVGA